MGRVLVIEYYERPDKDSKLYRTIYEAVGFHNGDLLEDGKYNLKSIMNLVVESGLDLQVTYTSMRNIWLSISTTGFKK